MAIIIKNKMINHRFRKNVLLLGGQSTDLGRKLVNRYTKPLMKRWNVFNVDSLPNREAQHNFNFDFTKPLTDTRLSELT